MNMAERNHISGVILDAAIDVHRNLGPGLLESVYQVCLCHELISRGLSITQQVYLPVIYKNHPLNLDFKIDILVENEIIIELKAIESILPVHEAQLITYLKLSNKRLGLLINFNVPRLVDGFKRMINGYDE
jgi:GxxExxY protein